MPAARLNVGREGAGGVIQRQVPFPTLGSVGEEDCPLHHRLLQRAPQAQPLLWLSLSGWASLSQDCNSGCTVSSLFHLSSPATPSSSFLEP